jgi:hypothetical protein
MGASQSQQQIHPLPLAPMLAISDDEMNAQKGCGNVSPSTSLFRRFGSANKL